MLPSKVFGFYFVFWYIFVKINDRGNFSAVQIAIDKQIPLAILSDE